MTKQEYNRNVWMYYMQLEKDFYDTLNYIELSEDNYLTYSKEYSKQLLSICSELDVVCKILCASIAPDEKRKNICDYAKVLSGYDDLSNAKAQCNYTNQEISPFIGWDEDNSPSWWKDYNDIKHQRTEDQNYKKGNLKNVFYALVGLFILNRYLCKRICSGRVMQEPEIRSNMFNMVGWNVCISEGNGFVREIRTNGHMSLTWEEE